MPTYIAAIDIGSNALRLLIKRMDDINAPYNPLVRQGVDLFSRIPIRLGTDVYTQGSISTEKELQLMEACRKFRLLMNTYNVSRYRACATAAFRAASNAKEIVERIQKETDIQIEIISGEEEAELTRNSFFAQNIEHYHNTLFADVGGGSTDVCLVSGTETKFIHSYPIGSMRKYDKLQKMAILAQLKNDLASLASEYQPLQVVGSGGSIHKIGVLFSDEINQEKVTKEAILRTIQELAPLAISERMRRYHLPWDRAEIIVEAAEIFRDIVNSTHASYIKAPKIGVRDGIIAQLASNLITK